MPSMDDRLPVLVVLVGPTAVGKSALSLQIAERFSGEILSADSRLLYRGMDKGTAKPTPVERAHIPHHLIDVTTPEFPWSLSQYLEGALAAFRQIESRGNLPLLVGGTGQYVRAFLEGWEIPPAQPDGRVRAELLERVETEGASSLYRELQSADPQAALKIDPRNIRRVVRAMEVILSTGKPFSEQQRKRSPVPFRAITVGIDLPRPELFARADARIDAMIAAGWVEEVRGLLAAGYSATLPAFSALGYGQIVRHIQGELRLEECIAEIRRATRRLIRHQSNWFSKEDPAIRWFQADGPLFENVAAYLEEKGVPRFA